MFGEWEEPDDPTGNETKGLKDKETTLKAIKDLIKDANEETLRSLELDKNVAALHGDRMAGLLAQKEQLERLIKIRNMSLEQISQMSEAEKEQRKSSMDLLDQLEKQMVNYGETAEEQLANLSKATDKIARDGAAAGQAFFGGIATKLGMASKASDTFLGKLGTMATKMQDPKFTKNFISKFREIFTLQNMVASGMMMIVQATISLILSVDKAAAAFAKATGTGKTHQDMLYEIAGEYRAWGITTKDTDAAMRSMFDKMPGWTSLSEAQAKSMAVTAAKMEKLGVATDDTAALFNDLTKSQGLSAEMAQKLGQDMAMEAESLQVSAGNYIKGFNQANRVLAVYGNKAPKIFRNITIAAQKAGVETSRLLDLAGKFDTFSDSAETAGRLNAILGSQFSATKLLRMEEDERIETVIKGIQASGRQFKDMDRFTQKAIAQTLGISDLNEARRILGSDVSGYRKMQKDAEMAAKKEEDMKKKAQAAMTAQQKLTMAFMEFAEVLKPALYAFQEFAQKILDFAERNADWLKPWIEIIFIFTTFKALLGPLKLLIAPLFSVILSTGTPAVTGFGAAAGGASAPTMKFSLALGGVSLASLLLAAALAIIILAFVYMVKELSKVESVGQGVTEFIIGCAVAVYILASALGVLGSVGLIGAGVLALIILEMVVFMDSMKGAGEATGFAFKQINSFLGKEQALTKISTALEGIGSSFKKMNNDIVGGGLVGSALDFIGIGGMAPTRKSPIAQMAEDLKPIIDNADSLAMVFSSIAEIMKADVGQAFKVISSSVDELYKSLKSIASGPVEIRHTLENLALVSSGASAGTTSGFGGVISAIKARQQMQVTIKLDPGQIQQLINEGLTDALGELAQ
jgi:hypothetical protein